MVCVWVNKENCQKKYKAPSFPRHQTATSGSEGILAGHKQRNSVLGVIIRHSRPPKTEVTMLSNLLPRSKRDSPHFVMPVHFQYQLYCSTLLETSRPYKPHYYLPFKKTQRSRLKWRFILSIFLLPTWTEIFFLASLKKHDHVLINEQVGTDLRMTPHPFHFHSACSTLTDFKAFSLGKAGLSPSLSLWPLQ